METRSLESPFQSDSVDRSEYIGGSEAYELLNEKTYGRGCARALAYRKIGVEQDFPPERYDRRAQNLQGLFKRGHDLEDLFAKRYAELTGRSLIRRNYLVRHPDHTGAAVHVDRIMLAYVDAEGRECPTTDVEIKSHGEPVFFNILRNGLPPGHILQLQWAMFCTGHVRGTFIIGGVFAELPLKHFELERDAGLMNIFAHAVDNFWNLLEHDELPDPLPDPQDQRCKVCPWRVTCRGEKIDPDELARLMAEKHGKKLLTAIRNDELDQALADRALILSEIEALDHDSQEEPGALQLVNARIKELLGDTEAAIVNGRWKIYRSPNAWYGIDTNRLRAEEPEIYKKYYVDGRPTGKDKLRVYSVAMKP